MKYPMHPLITILEETPSTNLYLQQQATQENLPEGWLVVANYQQAGKGQRGNSWESERGKNLTFSLYLKPIHIAPSHQFILSQLISLAVVEVLASYGESFSIKWPNDIYWKEKKVAGILIENELYGSQIGSTVVGIGLNVNQEQFLSPAPNPISLSHVVGRALDRWEVLNQLHQTILRYYKEHALGELSEAEVARRYFDLLFRQEGYHPYVWQGSQILAQIEGVEPDGHLLLRSEAGALLRCAFKEVSFVL